MSDNPNAAPQAAGTDQAVATETGADRLDEQLREMLPPKADPAAILRVKLSDARAKIAQARKSNMLDQLADGVCEAIDAFLETLPPA